MITRDDIRDLAILAMLESGEDVEIVAKAFMVSVEHVEALERELDE